MAGESEYAHAYSLFESAKDFSDMVAKEKYLRQARGAALLARQYRHPDADSLLDQIRSYASSYGIYL